MAHKIDQELLNFMRTLPAISMESLEKQESPLKMWDGETGKRIWPVGENILALSRARKEKRVAI